MLSESYLLDVASGPQKHLGHKLGAICSQAIRAIELTMKNAQLQEQLDAAMAAVHDLPDHSEVDALRFQINVLERERDAAAERIQDLECALETIRGRAGEAKRKEQGDGN